MEYSNIIKTTNIPLSSIEHLMCLVLRNFVPDLRLTTKDH